MVVLQVGGLGPMLGQVGHLFLLQGGRNIEVSQRSLPGFYLWANLGLMVVPQVGGLGPMLGQVGHFFRFSKEDVPYAKQRYLTEAKRLLRVLDKALEGGPEQGNGIAKRNC